MVTRGACGRLTLVWVCLGSACCAWWAQVRLADSLHPADAIVAFPHCVQSACRSADVVLCCAMCVQVGVCFPHGHLKRPPLQHGFQEVTRRPTIHIPQYDDYCQAFESAFCTPSMTTSYKNCQRLGKLQWCSCLVKGLGGMLVLGVCLYTNSHKWL